MKIVNDILAILDDKDKRAKYGVKNLLTGEASYGRIRKRRLLLYGAVILCSLSVIFGAMSHSDTNNSDTAYIGVDGVANVSLPANLTITNKANSNYSNEFNIDVTAHEACQIKTIDFELYNNGSCIGTESVIGATYKEIQVGNNILTGCFLNAYNGNIIADEVVIIIDTGTYNKPIHYKSERIKVNINVVNTGSSTSTNTATTTISTSSSGGKTSGSQTFKVGTDIQAGTYKLTGKKISGSDVYNGYYALRSSTGNSLDDIIENNWFQDGTAYVTCSDGQYLELTSCDYEKQ